MSIIESPVEIGTQVHPVDQPQIDEQIIQEAERQFKKEPPRDCSACHTKKTRACWCGGRIHNELHSGVFVEQCFSCLGGWHPAERHDQDG